MNDDFAAERFNIPKLEALDALRRARLTCGIHWWFNPAGSKRPLAEVRTRAGKEVGKTMAPRLKDFDQACKTSGLAVITSLQMVPSKQQRSSTSWLAPWLVQAGQTGVRVLFVDPDTGIGRSHRPEHVHPDEVAALATGHHVLVYQHRRQESAGACKKRVAGYLSSKGLHLEFWERRGVECLLVWVSKQGLAFPFPSHRLPPGLWVQVP